jgi:thiamine biosynthesis lipoprotein
MHDSTFPSMGSDIRLVIDGPGGADAARRQRAYVEDFAARLSRFRSDSELSALNSDEREVVPASQLLRTAVAAGIWAAERSGGLVDPTLVGAIERAELGEPVPLADALARAPARHPAAPSPAAAWRTIEVNGAIRRPPGVRFDTGGTGKGLCADAVAHRLSGYARFVVDCGGDMALRGPWRVDVEHPLTHEHVHTIDLDGGGVATSGLDRRVFRRPDGSYSHHLLDPSTGEPAWTGLVGVTAVASSALEAETLSKMALLAGPDRAREILGARAGVLFHDDGEVEVL